MRKFTNFSHRFQDLDDILNINIKLLATVFIVVKC